MTKIFNRKVGKEGEEIAAKYFVNKGYKILARNYSTKFGEIDLICSRSISSGHEVLCFVEVKLKRGDDFGTPEEMIGENKLNRVQRMAEYYLIENFQIAQKYPSWQVDAVCIVLRPDGKVERINHYENLTF